MWTLTSGPNGSTSIFIGDPTSPESPVEPGRDWVWREDRIQTLLSTDDADVLFISGCAANMAKFYSQFDHIVLLCCARRLDR